MKTEISRLLLTAVVSLTSASPVFAANTEAPPSFQEVFSLSLEDYWCENHLSVSDVDGDGGQDFVVMATGLSETNGPPWHYRCRAILLHAEDDGTFTDSVLTNFPGRYGYGAVTADLNNDGAPDLILREQSATHVLLNNGHGGFREVWPAQRLHQGQLQQAQEFDGADDADSKRFLRYQQILVQAQPAFALPADAGHDDVGVIDGPHVSTPCAQPVEPNAPMK